ncbi:hypothetical protein VPH35_105813 [Triticum aestivum]|uniref:Uncharacterized protein n=1 Tax=Triticum turgidum subsp. durum TaxID=4567 RepID=A0A9R0Y5A5_TRITD|nr:unnamed protein product [Triticum turgidum subsp. durum]
MSRLARNHSKLMCTICYILIYLCIRPVWVRSCTFPNFTWPKFCRCMGFLQDQQRGCSGEIAMMGTRFICFSSIHAQANMQIAGGGQQGRRDAQFLCFRRHSHDGNTTHILQSLFRLSCD